MKRTTGKGSQNNALHKDFELIGDALNMAGLDMKMVLKGEVEIWWTTEMVKQYLWKPLQKVMFNKEHTADLEKIGEIDAIHDQLMHILGKKHHIEYIPFPHDPKKQKEKQYLGAPPLNIKYEDHTPTDFD